MSLKSELAAVLVPTGHPAGRSVRMGNLRDRASGLFRYTREEEFIANTSRHVAKSPSNWERKKMVA